MEKIKLVFWDLVGTLITSNFSSDFYDKTLQKEKHSTSYIFNPYAWFLVDAFKNINMKQAIASNSKLADLENNLKNAPFKNFDMLLTVNNFKPKPSVQMFEYALKQHNLNHDQAIFIADSESDEIAARNMHLKFFHVDGSYESYQKIAKHFNFEM